MKLDPKVVSWKRDAASDPEKFWGEAAEALPWFPNWDGLQRVVANPEVTLP